MTGILSGANKQKKKSRGHFVSRPDRCSHDGFTESGFGQCACAAIVCCAIEIVRPADDANARPRSVVCVGARRPFIRVSIQSPFRMLLYAAGSQYDSFLLLFSVRFSFMALSHGRDPSHYSFSFVGRVKYIYKSRRFIYIFVKEKKIYKNMLVCLMPSVMPFQKTFISQQMN